MPVPMTLTTRKTRTMANKRFPMEACRNMDPKDRATPVRVRVPTTMPEPARMAAIRAALTMARDRASSNFLGVSHVRLSKKLRTMEIHMEWNAALAGEYPWASRAKTEMKGMK